MRANTKKRPPGNNRICRRLGLCAILAAACLTVGGCGKKGLQTKVVHGAVTYDNQKVEMGRVRFVPIDGTPGPASTARIVDGQYRIEARGGVPLGKHRVELDARKKTGRKVRGHTYMGSEMGMIDETVRLGPPVYAGPKSPLTAEITPQSDGRFDFDLPRQ